MTQTVRFWLKGLLSAAISAAANSVAVVIVDPQDFNLFQGGATKLGAVALVFALVAAAGFLAKHPLPDDGDPLTGITPRPK
jgi:hypothetical protein